MKIRWKKHTSETSTYYAQQNKTKIIGILWIEQNTTWTFQKQMTETTQLQSTNLQHSISSTTYPCIYLQTANTDRSYNIEKEEKWKYLWDIRILCATEQNQKSKCEHTQHKLFKSKWPKQHKCNQQIYNTQSQVQHIHAYSHPANTNPSYSIETEKK